MKQLYFYFNGYTGESMSDEQAKLATLPQYRGTVEVSKSLGAISVRIYHHINNGDTCHCYACNPRPLYRLAEYIKKDWSQVWFGAVPYLQAMTSLGSVQDDYGFDSGKSIVIYFMSNASTWKGNVAKMIKQELKHYTK